MKGVRKLLSDLILRLWSQGGKRGNSLALSNPASWWPGSKHIECLERDAMDPGRHWAGKKKSKSLSHNNSQTLQKSLWHGEVKTAVHTCKGAHTTSDLTQDLGSWGLLYPASLPERNYVVPWHCGFAFLPWFLGHKLLQAAPVRVQEQVPVLSLTSSLCLGVGAELVPPDPLEDCRGHVEARQRTAKPPLKRGLVLGSPSEALPVWIENLRGNWASQGGVWIVISCGHPYPKLWNSTNYSHSCRETVCIWITFQKCSGFSAA